MSFNNFAKMSEIPYRIVESLSQKGSENLFKLLYYNDYNALDNPNLTFKQKMDMIWKYEATDSKFNIFLKPLVVDEIIAQTTQMRINKLTIRPENHLQAVITYEFAFITGQNIAIVEKDGIPCPRIDLLEEELLKSLNGLDIGGIGYFQFSDDLSRLCQETQAINNGESFFGNTIVLALRYMSISESGVCNG